MGPNPEPKGYNVSRVEVAAFYHFARLPQFQALQQPVQALCDSLGVKGILLLADEGVNGTIAGSAEGVAKVLAFLRAIPGVEAMEHKMSWAEAMPFLRMKVRLKKEIVTIGDKSVDPLARVGTYVEAQDWNALISQPDVLLVDTRNEFEVRVGTFRGALDPKTKSFGEFPAFVRAHLDPKANTKIAMFCTGGIRCEKASSFMLQEGFPEVYHLKGGILKYLETIPLEQSLWDGGCFVFDQRVAVGHGLTPLNLAVCYGCRAPLEAEDLASPDYEEGVSCPHCAGLLTLEQKASARERHHQVKLAQARGAQHLGPEAV